MSVNKGRGEAESLSWAKYAAKRQKKDGAEEGRLRDREGGKGVIRVDI